MEPFGIVYQKKHVDLRQFEIGIDDAITNFIMGNVSMDKGNYTTQGCIDANMTNNYWKKNQGEKLPGYNEKLKSAKRKAGEFS